MEPKNIFDERGNIFCYPVIEGGQVKSISKVRTRNYEIHEELMNVIHAEIERNPGLVRFIEKDGILSPLYFRVYLEKEDGYYGQYSVSSDHPSIIALQDLLLYMIKKHRESGKVAKYFSSHSVVLNYKEIFSIFENFCHDLDFDSENLHRETVSKLSEKTFSKILVSRNVSFIKMIIRALIEESSDYCYSRQNAKKMMSMFQRLVCKIGKTQHSIELFSYFMETAEKKIDSIKSSLESINRYDQEEHKKFCFIKNLEYYCLNYFQGYALKDFTPVEIVEIMLIFKRSKINTILRTKDQKIVFPGNIFILSSMSPHKSLLERVIRDLFNVEGEFLYDVSCKDLLVRHHFAYDCQDASFSKELTERKNAFHARIDEMILNDAKNVKKQIEYQKECYLKNISDREKYHKEFVKNVTSEYLDFF